MSWQGGVSRSTCRDVNRTRHAGEAIFSFAFIFCHAAASARPELCISPSPTRRSFQRLKKRARGTEHFVLERPHRPDFMNLLKTLGVSFSAAIFGLTGC